MRHTTLRILIVWLLVASAPLCCCQANSWFAFARGHAASQVAPAAHDSDDESPCCELCTRPTPEKPRHDEQAPCESSCKVCPSCQGVAGGSGLDGAVRAPHFDAAEIVLPPFAWSLLCGLLEPGDPPSPHAADAGPPRPRSNRDLLRWHCALIV